MSRVLRIALFAIPMIALGLVATTASGRDHGGIRFEKDGPLTWPEGVEATLENDGKLLRLVVPQNEGCEHGETTVGLRCERADGACHVAMAADRQSATCTGPDGCNFTFQTTELLGPTRP